MNQRKVQPLGLYIIAYVVLSASIVGYFVGMQSPLRATQGPDERAKQVAAKLDESGVMLATSYSDMREALRGQDTVSQAVLKTLPVYEPGQDLPPISSQEKQFALQSRTQNRAFNGAPPTIPHPIEQMSVDSCLACHGEGLRTASLRVAKMSHPYYANCTQCHVESRLQELQLVALQGNSFAGLPAPDGGPRAYPGAPPQIPHSTWMRSDCLSCHGFTGNRGLQTTHPWRQNCSQCHAPSAELEQIPVNMKPSFLTPLPITE